MRLAFCTILAKKCNKDTSDECLDCGDLLKALGDKDYEWLCPDCSRVTKGFYPGYYASGKCRESCVRIQNEETAAEDRYSPLLQLVIY